jgi:predicted PurR-regulated permease PerM
MKVNKLKLFYIAAAAVILYILFVNRTTVSSILKPFIYSLIFAYLLDPIVDFFETKGLRRILSVIIVYLILIALVLFFSFIIAPRLVKDIQVLVASLPKYSIEIQKMVKSFQDSYMNSNLPQEVKMVIDDNISILQDYISTSLQSILDSVVSAFSKVVYFILVPVIVFYLLKDADYFKKQVILFLPTRHRNKAILLFRDIDNAFGKYIRGQIIVAIFIGILTTLALSILKVKYAVFLGLFSGIANIIPYFGPIIGLVPTIVFALFDSPAKALYAAAAFILIQQIESGILTPKIIGQSVGIHPVYVILSLFIGGQLMGVAGMVIAVPVLAAVKLTVRHLVRYIRHET